MAQDASSLAAIQAQITQLQTQLRTLQREAASRDAALRRAQQDATQARAEAARANSRGTGAAVGTATGGTAAVGAAGSGGNQVAGATNGSPAQQTQPLQGTPQPGAGNEEAGQFVRLGGPINPNGTALGGAAPPSVVSTAVDASSPTIRVGNVAITLGGFIDLSGVYRSSNLTSGISTNFGTIPFRNSPNAHTGETRFSAQHSRVSLLVAGKVSPTVNVAGYLEADFDGAATTSNSYQTNSYTPRLRQAYAQYDDSGNGLHFMGGQGYSLATGFTTGLTLRKESIPLTIDANFLPGYVYVRSPQLRVVKDFGKNYHVGFSIEAPESAYSFSGGTLSATQTNGVTGATLAGTLPGGTSGNSVLVFNTGGSYLNNTANYSTDVTPDLVLKFAADPGYGHYEVFGLGRTFKTVSSRLARAGVAAGAGKDEIAVGGGIGGSTVIPILPKLLDFTGNVLAGYGVSRYLSGEIADATLGSNGQPRPLGEIGASFGLVGHPVKDVDLYAYGGFEQVKRTVFSTSTGTFGYGSPTNNVAGCNTENASCSAQTRALENGSVGAWWRFDHGPWGTLQAGAQYGYTHRIAFHGAGSGNASSTVGRGSTPKADENEFFFTLRYLPFQ